MSDISERLAKMSPAERMMEGLKGDQEARSVLVRDPNRIVYSAVLQSPRLTDVEVEAFASMKDVSTGTDRGFDRGWPSATGAFSSHQPGTVTLSSVFFLA